MLHLKIFLEYLIVLYIFRISLCVTIPVEDIWFKHVTKRIGFTKTKNVHKI